MAASDACLPGTILGPNGSPITSRTFLSGATNGSSGGPSWPIRSLDPLRKLITARDHFTVSFLSAKIYANFGVIKGAIDEKAMLAIGNAWFPLFHGGGKVRSPEVEAWAEEATRWLVEEWMPMCDVRGPNFDFATGLFLDSISIDRDGDAFTLLTKSAATGFPQIQSIPARQIGQWNQTTGYNTDEVVADGPYKGFIIRNGVIMTRQETPVAFRKLGEVRGEYQDIPERSMIQAFEPQWGDGNRGLPSISASIEDMRKCAQSDEWEQMAMLIASSIGLIEYNERGGVDAADPANHFVLDDTGTPTGLQTRTIYGGMYRYFKANSGSKFEQHVNLRPGAEWESFQDRQIRKALSGANWPYQLAWKRENVNGTTQRAVLEQARNTVADRQILLTPKARRKVQWAISVAMQPGPNNAPPILPPYPGNDKGGFLKWGFTMPPEMSIDPGKDGDRERQDYILGQSTMQTIQGRRGTTWLAVREQRQREVRDLIVRAQQESKDTGVPFDTCLTLLQQQTSNANAPGGRFGSAFEEEPPITP